MDEIYAIPQAPSVYPVLPLKSLRLTANQLRNVLPSEYWTLYYVESGAVEIGNARRAHHLLCGHGILLPPDGEHHLLTFRDTPATVTQLNLRINGQEIRLLQEKQLTFDTKCRKLLREIVAEAEQYRRSMRENGTLYGAEHYLQLLCTQLMIQLRRAYYAQMKGSGVAKESAQNPSLWEQSLQRNRRVAAEDSTPPVGLRGTRQISPQEPNSLQLFKQLEVYLRERVYENITLDELVSEFHFSKTHLSQTFKTHAGQTILTYYNNLKIEEAKRLIAETDMNFSQISAQLNFSSLHYFSRLFKKHTGLSPSEFQLSVT